ncbi:MAG: DUF4160 domain-containing protein [Gammaproteobacteria bacterium]|nr:DUF4160 domain-containing protein [Gammaproteobacteria bacterium]
MYPNDHNPPHFHVTTSDGRECLIEIATLIILAGHVSKREIQEALAWASEQRDFLITKWKELNP